MTRLVVGPFNRVEGDLEVQLEVSDGQVSSARVNATMYRGFEQILQGRHPFDALVYAPRVCGICSVSQSVAASRALAELCGVTPPDNGMLAINLMAATENLADHLSHFYLFFMPDFTRPVYAGRRWHADAVEHLAAQHGGHQRLAIAARQRWFTLMGTLGGKWPHTESVQPGGSSRAIEPAEQIRLLASIREFRRFLEKTLFAAPLEQFAGLNREAELWAWHDCAPADGDVRRFLAIVQDLGLDRLGRGPGVYLSYGAYPRAGGGFHFARGVWRSAQTRLDAFDLAAIREDVTHTWLTGDGTARHPAEGLTIPEPDKPGAYTWNKAPRLAGEVVETGALARQLADAHPLIRDAVTRCGGTVYTRVLARLLELARVVPLMESWIQALQPGEPYWLPVDLPERGIGAGLTEAARGSLGHWLTVRDGRIENYQIVAPTSWNFSPRDDAGRPGALEGALEGVPVGANETVPVAVQHVVRSFDPCMVCTVH
ncbi:nickel-dependent hydrogenase large subunit [Paraburkholderia aromaticivorans]|uniref:HupV protein n=1 Tax=Paraburkholderia aromaticivorans TaxID=2026199 RepID=A0A248VYE6_9BURK|nr:nickel-dependent hydrogenase large subunit [Paraburkholderia aromaticivorans]ASW04034.1 HupV protein [Paraburkholderia aromaticivorans]